MDNLTKRVVGPQADQHARGLWGQILGSAKASIAKRQADGRI